MTMTSATTAPRRHRVREWLGSWMESLAVFLIAWAFKSERVQEVFVDRITCNTPIGHALNDRIESCISDIGAGDIGGLDDLVDDRIDHWTRHDLSVEADNVQGLDDAVTTIVEDMSFKASAIEDLDDAIENVLYEGIHADRIEGLAQAVQDVIRTQVTVPESPAARLVAQRLSY